MRDFERRGEADPKVLARLDMLQSRQRIVSTSPPIPVSVQTDVIPESGVIGRYLVSADGIVTRVYAYVGNLEKDSKVEVTISRDNDAGGSFYTFKAKTGLFTAIGLEFPIYAGDRLTMKASDPSKISDIWISFLYEVTINQGTREYFLVEDLLSAGDAE